MSGPTPASGAPAPGRQCRARSANEFDPTLRRWEIATAKQTQSVKVVSFSTISQALAFDPSGKRLVFGDGWSGVPVRDVPSLEVRATLGAQRHPSACVAVSPDGKTTASGEWDGNVQLGDQAKNGAGPIPPHASAHRRGGTGPGGGWMAESPGACVDAPERDRARQGS